MHTCQTICVSFLSYYDYCANTKINTMEGDNSAPINPATTTKVVTEPSTAPYIKVTTDRCIWVYDDSSVR